MIAWRLEQDYKSAFGQPKYIQDYLIIIFGLEKRPANFNFRSKHPFHIIVRNAGKGREEFTVLIDVFLARA